MKTKKPKGLKKGGKYAGKDNVFQNVSIFQNVTTLHGTSHFKRKKGKQLFLWAVLMIANIALTITFLLVISKKYNNDDIVTKIHSDCTLDQVPFPAVSICNFNMVSLKQAQLIAPVLRRHNISQLEIDSFFRDLPGLKVGILLTMRNNYTEVMKVLKNHYFSVNSIMAEVHQKCENLLLYCEFNGKEKKCETIFKLTQTYEGYCCTFNYVGVEDDLGESPLIEQDQDFDYYYEQGDGESKRTSIIASLQSGRSSGLRVVFNVEPQDYAERAFTSFYGAKVLISDPNAFPEMSASYRYIAIGESLDIKITPELFEYDASMRSVDLHVRKCWFHDEVTLEHTDRYSYETCLTECKMKSYLKGCGCVPYKYPADKSVRICEFQELACLRNIRVHWETRTHPCVPMCYKECSDKGYTLRSDITTFLKNWYPENVTNNRNEGELSSVQVYFNKYNINCYKTSPLMDFTYFIATYCGVFTLSFGASIITLFEIFYLLLSWIMEIIYNSILDKFFTHKFIH